MTSLANSTLLHPGMKEGRVWALDNGIYTDRYNLTDFLAALEKLEPYKQTCLFITCPDVVGNAKATIQRFHRLKPLLNSWPIAFVAQDSLKVDEEEGHFYVGSDLDFTDFCGEVLGNVDERSMWETLLKWRQFVDLDDFDWLFIGGTTEWKMSEETARCIRFSKRHDKKVHVGRVNSIKRYKHFQLLGADSCDGTKPIYEPDVARRRFRSAMSQNPLFILEENL